MGLSTLKNVLKSYAGPLPSAQIAKGISLAQANARRLLADARLLLDEGRLPSAAALAILSIEERGKTVILKRLALVKEPADLKSAWRDYRCHRAKNAGSIIPELVGQGARTLHYMAGAVDPAAEHTGILDALKQVSLYTDCLGNAHWSVPDEVINEQLVRGLISSAERMWGNREVTVREIELWRDIVGPYWDRDGMAEAVIQWQTAMVTEGLSDTAPEALAAFMRSQPVEIYDKSGGEESGPDVIS